ncbi:MAG: YkgJ family cysteine cluster protein [Candidatus Micrarchaeota archaeon]
MVSPCSLCTAKCCKGYLITVTSFDILRIMQNTNKKPEEFCSLVYSNILNTDNDTVLECFVKEDDKYPCEYVLALKSYPCTFLGSDNRCTIHEFAPLGCRMYPYKSTEGELIPRPLCPSVSNLLFRIQKPTVKIAEYQKHMKAYKEIVEIWNKKKGKLDDCMQFLLEESKKCSLE